MYLPLNLETLKPTRTDSELQISMPLTMAFPELFQLFIKLKSVEPGFSKRMQQNSGTYLPLNLEIRKHPRTDSEQPISTLLKTVFLELFQLLMKPTMEMAKCMESG